jgi:hypothetical protein
MRNKVAIATATIKMSSLILKKNVGKHLVQGAV